MSLSKYGAQQNIQCQITPRFIDPHWYERLWQSPKCSYFTLYDKGLRNSNVRFFSAEMALQSVYRFFQTGTVYSIKQIHVESTSMSFT